MLLGKRRGDGRSGRLEHGAKSGGGVGLGRVRFGGLTRNQPMIALWFLSLRGVVGLFLLLCVNLDAWEYACEGPQTENASPGSDVSTCDADGMVLNEVVDPKEGNETDEKGKGTVKRKAQRRWPRKWYGRGGACERIERASAVAKE